MSLVSPSLWVTPVKISISGLMYVTGVTVTGVTFLMDNTSEDQYIRSYVCHWCHLPYGVYFAVLLCCFCLSHYINKT